MASESALTSTSAIGERSNNLFNCNCGHCNNYNQIEAVVPTSSNSTSNFPDSMMENVNYNNNSNSNSGSLASLASSSNSNSPTQSSSNGNGSGRLRGLGIYGNGGGNNNNGGGYFDGFGGLPNQDGGGSSPSLFRQMPPIRNNNNNHHNGHYGGNNNNGPPPGFTNVLLPLRSRQLAAHQRQKIKFDFCVFCRNNGEDESYFLSHTLKDDYGQVICPILHNYTCPICGATGRVSHTIKYCPQNKDGKYHENYAPITTLKSMRSSVGKPRPLVAAPPPSLMMSTYGGSAGGDYQVDRRSVAAMSPYAPAFEQQRFFPASDPAPFSPMRQITGNGANRFLENQNGGGGMFFP